MSELTIHLRVNPETGKKDILIDLRSDGDALPNEHEHQHRQLVEKLIGEGILGKAEVGNVVVQRDSAKAVSSPESDSPIQQAKQVHQRQAEQEGRAS